MPPQPKRFSAPTLTAACEQSLLFAAQLPAASAAASTQVSTSSQEAPPCQGQPALCPGHGAGQTPAIAGELRVLERLCGLVAGTSHSPEGWV